MFIILAFILLLLFSFSSIIGQKRERARVWREKEDYRREFTCVMRFSSSYKSNYILTLLSHLAEKLLSCCGGKIARKFLPSSSLPHHTQEFIILFEGAQLLSHSIQFKLIIHYGVGKLWKHTQEYLMTSKKISLNARSAHFSLSLLNALMRFPTLTIDFFSFHNARSFFLTFGRINLTVHWAGTLSTTVNNLGYRGKLLNNSRSCSFRLEEIIFLRRNARRRREKTLGNCANGKDLVLIIFRLCDPLRIIIIIKLKGIKLLKWVCNF